jgi:arylsulfatase A-like enzyme
VASGRNSHPNLVFVFGDQWRGQAVGYRGDPNVRTPHVDRFAAESIDWVNAVAGTPVCCPYRASLMTGQHPLTHGVFVNDVCITSDAVPFAECLHRAGYDTAYIGKWHVDGHGREAFVPPERRLGFRYWRGFECNHNYHASDYYGDIPERQRWQGYDAEAQTRLACEYLRGRDPGKPFALLLSWAPPHDPYQTAPAEYRAHYDPTRIVLRPNVPDSCAAQAREWLAGYYAHIEALDTYFGWLLETLRQTRGEEQTVVVFTSDHGDMLGSQGTWKKQKPWEESLCIPFLLRYPERYGRTPRQADACLSTEDVMPTLLGLCGVEVPPTVQGVAAAAALDGVAVAGPDSALLACHFPFHEWNPERGGKEYRGLRTRRYTYCRDLRGPWLLYDNQADPYQQANRVDDPGLAAVRADLDRRLSERLAAIGDRFRPGSEYLRERRIRLNQHGDISIFPDRGPYLDPEPWA